MWTKQVVWTHLYLFTQDENGNNEWMNDEWQEVKIVTQSQISKLINLCS